MDPTNVDGAALPAVIVYMGLQRVSPLAGLNAPSCTLQLRKARIIATLWRR